MEEKIIDLEVRAAHQEAALDELTRTVLKQQQMIESLQNELEQLRKQMRQFSPVRDLADEAPPPHY
jgi:SlyX protein